MLLWLDNLEDLSDQKWTADMVDISKPDITHEGRIYGFPVGIEGTVIYTGPTCSNRPESRQHPKTWMN